MLKLVVEFCWLVGKVVLISAVVECYGLEPLFVLCGIFCASEILGHFKDVEVWTLSDEFEDAGFDIFVWSTDRY